MNKHEIHQIYVFPSFFEMNKLDYDFSRYYISIIFDYIYIYIHIHTYIYMYIYIICIFILIYNTLYILLGTLKKKMNLRASLGLCASLTWFYWIFCCLCKKSLILKMFFNEVLSAKIRKLWTIDHWTELKCKQIATVPTKINLQNSSNIP